MTARDSDQPVRDQPVRDQPVRDQHGRVLPGTGESSQPVGPQQVDDALAALPGWSRRGATLVRQVKVPADSRAGLREGVRSVAGDPARLGFDESAEGLMVLVGAGAGDLTAADLEAAARIDTVLSGSGTDRGAGR
jgi:hypothetical protein